MISGKIAAGLPLLLVAASCVPASAGPVPGALAAADAPAAAPAPGFSFAAAPPISSLRPLGREQEAQWQQAAGQFDAPSQAPAAPFRHSGKDSDVSRALDCLSQAVYYEARSESDDGQRAVAQVVLNRVRHPAFPSSVCAVVYQGSGRRTGCQFTFTCDGSLGHRPHGWSWERARRIAAAALAGEVYAPVGNATHYHTRAILPYWAPSLRRAAVVGAHVFYRWRGGQGESGAFRQAYAGAEPAPFVRRAAVWQEEHGQPQDALPVERVRLGSSTVRVHRGEAAPVEEVAEPSFGVRVHFGEMPTS